MIEQARTSRELSGGPGGLGSIFDQSDLPGLVHISHGPFEEFVPIAGATVGEVRRRFAARLDLGDGSIAVVDGQDVTDDTILRQGQALTFVNRIGEKGCRDLSECARSLHTTHSEDDARVAPNEAHPARVRRAPSTPRMAWPMFAVASVAFATCVRRAPSPLNGERAGARGEAVRCASRVSRRGPATSRGQRPRNTGALGPWAPLRAPRHPPSPQTHNRSHSHDFA